MSDPGSGRKSYGFCTKTWESFFGDVTVTFEHAENEAENKPYTIQRHDWYMNVVIEKADKVKEDRHLLTRELLLSYRWAIREGFNHQLDPHLKNRWDHPRNRNTIAGIQGYVDNIKAKSDAEMEEILNG